MTHHVDIRSFTQCQARVKLRDNVTNEVKTAEGSCAEVWKIIKNIAATFESFDVKLSAPNTPDYHYTASGIRPTEEQSFTATLAINYFAQQKTDPQTVNSLLNGSPTFGMLRADRRGQA